MLFTHSDTFRTYKYYTVHSTRSKISILCKISIRPVPSIRKFSRKFVTERIFSYAPSVGQTVFCCSHFTAFRTAEKIFELEKSKINMSCKQGGINFRFFKLENFCTYALKTRRMVTSVESHSGVLACFRVFSLSLYFIYVVKKAKTVKTEDNDKHIILTPSQYPMFFIA